MNNEEDLNKPLSHRIQGDFIESAIEDLQEEVGNFQTFIGEEINVYKFRIVSGIQLVTNQGEIKPILNEDGTATYSISKSQQYANVITGNEPITIVWENATQAFNTAEARNNPKFRFRVGTHYKCNWTADKITEKDEDIVNIFGNEFKTTFTNNTIELTTNDWIPDVDDMSLFFYIIVDKAMNSYQLLELTKFENQYNVQTKEFLKSNLSFENINLKYASSGAQILDFVQFGAIGFGYPFPIEIENDKGEKVVAIDTEKAKTTGVDSLQLDLITTGALSSIMVLGGVYDNDKPDDLPVPQRLFLHESLYPVESEFIYTKPNMNYLYNENSTMSFVGFLDGLQKGWQNKWSFDGYNIGETKTVFGGVRVDRGIQTKNEPLDTISPMVDGATLWDSKKSDYRRGDVVYTTTDGKPFDINTGNVNGTYRMVALTSPPVGLFPDRGYFIGIGGINSATIFWQSLGTKVSKGSQRTLVDNGKYIDINQDYFFNAVEGIKNITSPSDFKVNVAMFLNLNSYCNFYIDELVTETSETVKVTLSNFLGILGSLWRTIANGLDPAWATTNLNQLGQPLNLLIPLSVWNANKTIMLEDSKEYLDLNYFIDDKSTQLNPIPVNNLCSFRFSLTHLIKDTSQVRSSNVEGKGKDGIWDTRYLGQTHFEDGTLINTDGSKFAFNPTTTTTIMPTDNKKVYIIDYVNFKAIYSGDVRLSAYKNVPDSTDTESRYSSYFSTKSKMRKYPNIIGNEIKFNYWNEFNTLGQNVEWPISTPETPSIFALSNLPLIHNREILNKSNGGFLSRDMYDTTKTTFHIGQNDRTIPMTNDYYFKWNTTIGTETLNTFQEFTITSVGSQKRFPLPEIGVYKQSSFFNTDKNFLLNNTFDATLPPLNIFQLTSSDSYEEAMSKANTIRLEITFGNGVAKKVDINLNTQTGQLRYSRVSMDWQRDLFVGNFAKTSDNKNVITNPTLPNQPTTSTKARKLKLFWGNFVSGSGAPTTIPQSATALFYNMRINRDTGILTWKVQIPRDDNNFWIIGETKNEEGVWGSPKFVNPTFESFTIDKPIGTFDNNNHFPYNGTDLGVITKAYFIKK